MRVLVSCANGSGTSLMMMRTAKKALEGLGFDITNIHPCSISEGKNTARNYDVVYTPTTFTDMFKDAAARGVEVIGIKNPMSAKEIAEATEKSSLPERFLNK